MSGKTSDCVLKSWKETGEWGISDWICCKMHDNDQGIRQVEGVREEERGRGFVILDAGCGSSCTEDSAAICSIRSQTLLLLCGWAKPRRRWGLGILATCSTRISQGLGRPVGVKTGQESPKALCIATATFFDWAWRLSKLRFSEFGFHCGSKCCRKCMVLFLMHTPCNGFFTHSHGSCC